MTSEAMPGQTTRTRYEISFPHDAAGGLGQDEEWCLVQVDGETRRLRFHDYADIYGIPGLYEQIFYEVLACSSPPTVVGLLVDELRGARIPVDDLRVLDVGAGNVMVGEELAEAGAGSIVGIDIIEEAAAAAERDRPDVYDGYFVVDLTAVPGDMQRELEDRRFNTLTSVAALGFGDIPPAAFANAYDLLDAGGWLAFSIKEDFLEGEQHGFAGLIRSLLDHGMIEMRAQKRYLHRLAVDGTQLHYMAIVARKQRPASAAPLVG
jgi:predicted TPR repeat methyltransferase